MVLLNQFKELRIKNGYKSQKALAEKLFVNQTAVSQWERGVTTPSPPVLLKLSEMYGVSTDYLLGKNEKKASPPEGELAKPLQEPFMDEIYRAAQRLSPEARKIILAQIEAVQGLESGAKK